ncbi:hypothetical protein HYU12_02615 [Candidatus Woesearchaeota archaeon]|nr:hypothetical protein [Candidatus Woesearchaeota archaeon]
MNNNSASSLDDVVAVEVRGINRKSPSITLNFAANVKPGHCIVARRLSVDEIAGDNSLSLVELLGRLLEFGLVYDSNDSGLLPLVRDFVLAPSGADYVNPLRLLLSSGVQGISLKSFLPKELQSYFIKPANIVRDVRNLSGAVVRAVDYCTKQFDIDFALSLSEKDAVFLLRTVYSELTGVNSRVINDIFPDRYIGEVTDKKREKFKDISMQLLSASEQGFVEASYDVERGRSVFGVNLAETLRIITELSHSVAPELFGLMRCEAVIDNGRNYEAAAGRLERRKGVLLSAKDKEVLGHAKMLRESALIEKALIVAQLGVMAEGYGQWGAITSISRIMETLSSYGTLTHPVMAAPVGVNSAAATTI